MWVFDCYHRTTFKNKNITESIDNIINPIKELLTEYGIPWETTPSYKIEGQCIEAERWCAKLI